MSKLKTVGTWVALLGASFSMLACQAQDQSVPPEASESNPPVMEATAEPTEPAAPDVAEVAPNPGERLAALNRDRHEIALALTEPIANCLARDDTNHAAFHGCIDWHSSVHATWALVAYTGVTGDEQYVPLIEETLLPELVAAERDFVNRRTRFEMPYGRAWFLRLARDHARVFDSDLLTPMADDIAASMVNYYQRQRPTPLTRNYNSASWALLNLHEYATWRGDEETVAMIERDVANRFVGYGLSCPFESERDEWSDFIGVCANWAWVAQKSVPEAKFVEWLYEFMPDPSIYTPVTAPRNAHHNGQNFSRAWGFWAMYEATGDQRYLNAYLDHFLTAYERTETWNGDYRRVSHWVAQFGMLALVLSSDEF